MSAITILYVFGNLAQLVDLAGKWDIEGIKHEQFGGRTKVKGTASRTQWKKSSFLNVEFTGMIDDMPATTQAIPWPNIDGSAYSFIGTDVTGVCSLQLSGTWDPAAKKWTFLGHAAEPGSTDVVKFRMTIEVTSRTAHRIRTYRTYKGNSQYIMLSDLWATLARD